MVESRNFQFLDYRALCFSVPRDAEEDSLECCAELTVEDVIDDGIDCGRQCWQHLHEGVVNEIEEWWVGRLKILKT